MEELVKTIVGAWPSLVLPLVVSIGLILFFKTGVDSLRTAVAGLTDANESLMKDNDRLQTRIAHLADIVQDLHSDYRQVHQAVAEVGGELRVLSREMSRLSASMSENDEQLRRSIETQAKAQEAARVAIATLERRLRWLQEDSRSSSNASQDARRGLYS